MNYMHIDEGGFWECQYCCTRALIYESVSHLPDCPVILEEKKINCQHVWVEVYNGVKCKECELFYPDNGNYFAPLDEGDVSTAGAEEWDDDPDEDYVLCTTCGENPAYANETCVDCIERGALA
jgi:hypothetical protein